MSRSILVIVAHPALQRSRASNAMVAKIANLGCVTINDLYQQYPDFFIDVNREQELLVAHDIIVFQHPLYWYSCPALMKEWIDVVLEHNFAYGSHGDKLAGKSWQSVVTTGGTAESYKGDSEKNHTIDELFLPFRRTSLLCSMNYINPLIYYGISYKSKDKIDSIASEYHDAIISLSKTLADN